MYTLYYLNSTSDDKIYIGITNNPDRRYYEHINYTVEKKYYNGNWIRKTLSNGGNIIMNIVVNNLKKKTAIELEIKMIELIKRISPDKITNTAQGGLGFNHKGIPHSESHKKSLEKAQPHKVRIPKDILYDLYVNQKLSKKKIGNMYCCGATTIDRRLVEYKIPIRKTTNYKVSYKLDKELVIKMFVEKNMTICDIAQEFGVGHSGIRSLLQREKLDTGLNKFSNKTNIDSIYRRFNQLVESGMKRMKIYETLSIETGLSKGYLSKIRLSNGNLSSLNNIIYISSVETEEEVYRLNHYTNFQPLYWEDNLKKSNKIINDK